MANGNSGLQGLEKRLWDAARPLLIAFPETVGFGRAELPLTTPTP